MIEHVEWKFPNTFEYIIFKDKQMTGNFEISLYRDGAMAGEGIRVHSGKMRTAFPHANWELFECFLKAALKSM